ncbi:MAG: TIR domain-containing protein, partial [Clostridiales bacterium]|nr:TIR domain-containing protein [Clostridiales bacterium]
MGNRFCYDAFISYRHCFPDSEIAQNLQKKLENFRLPKAIIEKTGKKRPLRIFRDETELSVADDLSDAISTALWESKYLICVCSPEYLDSVWCMKEIEAFLRFNDRKHILLVLADGEPDTAFPEILTYEELFQLGPDGHPQKYRQYKEPLAADCRGDSSKERKAKIDSAVVRLVSGIRGLPYEELAQRHRKEAYNRARNRVLAAFGVLLAIIAVGVFFLVRISRQKAQISRQQDELTAQKNEIEEQRNTIQQKYADSMAGVSENLLRDGRRKDAVYAARSVLPDQGSDDYSENSLRALSNAMGIYEFSDHAASDDMIRAPSAVSQFDVSPMGGYVMVRSLDSKVFVMDISNDKMLLMYEDLNFADAGFDGERGFVYQGENESYTYFDFSSATETDLGIEDAKIISDLLGNGYASITDDEIVIFRGPEALCRIDVRGESLPDTVNIRSFAYVFFSVDGDEAWIFITDQDSGTTYIYSADLLSGHVERRYTDQSWIYSFCSDGESMLCLYDAYSSRKKVFLKDLHTGEQKNAEWGEACSGFEVCGDDIVIYDQTTIYFLNRNLEVIRTIDVDVDLSTSVLTPDGIAIFDLKDGCYLIRNGECRFFDPDIDDAKLLWAKDYANGTMYLSGTGEDQINTFSFRKTDYLKPYSDTVKEFESSVLFDDPEVSSLQNLVLGKETEFGKDMIYSTIMCENADYAAIQLWDGRVYIYRRSSGEPVKKAYAMEGFVQRFYYDENGGNYFISSERYLEIYDDGFRTIGSISDCQMIGYDE